MSGGSHPRAHYNVEQATSGFFEAFLNPLTRSGLSAILRLSPVTAISREEDVETMSQVDALIFDVDGVLVDANDTYLKVIQRALKIFLGDSGEISRGEHFTPWQYRTAKGHPCFNDDYDLAWFGLCALLEFRGASPSSKREEKLPEAIWRELLQECPLEGSLSWIERRFPQGPPREEIRTLCEEIYFGEEYSGMTGKSPLRPLERGLWKLDTPLVRWHWSSLPLPSAIYTGRPETELRLALGVLRWEDFPRDRCITPDLGISKPSPRGLEVLAEAMQSTNPAFFGDSQSDAQAFRSYGRGRFCPIGSLIPEMPRWYPSLNEALEDLGISVPSPE